MDIQKQLQSAIDNKNSVKLYGLLRDGANPNVMDNYGTPLQKACIHPHYEVLNTLLTYGANPNAQDKNGQSPFHTLAFYLDHAGKIHGQAGDIIQLFLEHGADMDLLNNRRETPFDKASPYVQEIMNEAYATWQHNGARTKKTTPKLKF